MCRIDDCEHIEGYTTRVIKKARKSHKCHECYRQIEAGESYRRNTGILEGSPFEAVTCSHCQVAADWLVKNCGGFVHSQVGEEIHEHTIEYPAIAEPLKIILQGIRSRWVSMPVPAMPPEIPVTDHA